MLADDDHTAIDVTEPDDRGGPDELAELVGDAVKALSIGGTLQPDEKVRDAVDRLRRPQRTD